MKEMEQAVATAFSNIAGSGFIEKQIEEQLSKSIAGIVKSQLESYSEFGKALNEHVKKALQVDFSGLGLPGYNDMILKIVRRQVDAGLADVLSTQVEGQLTKLLKPAPAEIKLSELIKEFIEQSADDCPCDNPNSISLHIEKSDRGYRRIYLDKDEGKSMYACAIHIAITGEGEVYSLKINEFDPKKTLFVGPIYGFERRLFQMHAAGTKLIVDGDDEDSFDTYYPGRD